MLAQLRDARKIDCSYAYSAQEGSAETCTPASAASVKVAFLEELYVLDFPLCWRDFFTDVVLLLSLLLVHSQ